MSSSELTRKIENRGQSHQKLHPYCSIRHTRTAPVQLKTKDGEHACNAVKQQKVLQTRRNYTPYSGTPNAGHVPQALLLSRFLEGSFSRRSISSHGTITPIGISLIFWGSLSGPWCRTSTGIQGIPAVFTAKTCYGSLKVFLVVSIH